MSAFSESQAKDIARIVRDTVEEAFFRETEAIASIDHRLDLLAKQVGEEAAHKRRLRDIRIATAVAQAAADDAGSHVKGLTFQLIEKLRDGRFE